MGVAHLRLRVTNLSRKRKTIRPAGAADVVGLRLESSRKVGRLHRGCCCSSAHGNGNDRGVVRRGSAADAGAPHPPPEPPSQICGAAIRTPSSLHRRADRDVDRRSSTVRIDVHRLVSDEYHRRGHFLLSHNMHKSSTLARAAPMPPASTRSSRVGRSLAKRWPDAESS